MRVPLYVLAAALASTSAGCGNGDPDVHPIREPDYGYVRPFGYTPSGAASGSMSSGSTSKWNYYRNYRGTIHQGSEGNP